MILKKYATLLVEYCLEIQNGEKVCIHSSFLAEPLVRELYREILERGAHPEILWQFSEQNSLFYTHASDHQLDYVSSISEMTTRDFDAHLYIRAPYNLREEAGVATEKRDRRMKALAGINKIYAERTGSGELKRCLCQYPTQANAQEAGMSLSEYERFVYEACFLYSKNPIEEWVRVRREQQRIVDFLNRKSKIRYVNKLSDICFSVKERTWINSDGRANMPSGEVFTGPVEDSVEGIIHFDYPSIYLGKEIEGVTLEVKGGEVCNWKAERGEELLTQILSIKGARFFGEAAIGTNYRINRPTKNILFDEKIGGTIHMALGQSYLHTGGRNESAIHWDLIADMKDGACIYADDELIYKDGNFVIF